MRRHTRGWDRRWSAVYLERHLSTSSNQSIKQLHTRNNSVSSKRQDISWNFAQDNVLGIAHHKGVAIYDTRQGSLAQEFSFTVVVICRIPFTSPCTLLRFNPLTPHVFITGAHRRLSSFPASEDDVLALWDLRYTKHFAHQLEDHGDSVICAAWSPHSAAALATGSADMKVMLWDLTKVRVGGGERCRLGTSRRRKRQKMVLRNWSSHIRDIRSECVMCGGVWRKKAWWRRWEMTARCRSGK